MREATTTRGGGGRARTGAAQVGSAGRRRRSRSQASQADRHDLYQRSVQEPEPDLLLVQRIYRSHFGRPLRLLREDFCGTAHASCEWVRMHRDNRALGVDLDPEPLAWGRDRNLAALTPAQRARVELVQGDVRDALRQRVEATVAFNFSYFVFRSRPELLDYFRRARAGLRREGLLILDAYGGPDSQRTSLEPRKLAGFTYVWEQHRFDPIHHHAVNYIHFEFPDGSSLRRAFRYEWRLWTLPEIRELLSEAGFSRVEVYWEGTDRDTGEGNSIFTRRESAPDDPAWVAYVVGRV